MTLTRYLYLLLLFAIFSSCKIGVYTMSERQIQEHFDGKKNKLKLKYIKYKDYHIHHAVIGDSTKPLLLNIHGAPGNWYSSINLLEDTALQQNFRMISVDRIGFGKSNAGYSVTSIQQHVRYLEKVVSEYNVPGRKIHILGTSYGAPIAAAFAMENPKLVDELYLISPVLDPSTEKIFWFSYLGKVAFINMWLNPALNVATDEKFAHRRELRKLKNNWKQITSKTYVIMGENDWIADTANLGFARKMLVNARDPEFYLLPNVGHSVVWQRSDLLKNLLLKKHVADKQFTFALPSDKIE